MTERQELINKLVEEGVTAQLWNVGFNPKNSFDSRYPNIYGYIVADTKNRFMDNERITTSIIEKIYTDENGRTFAKTYYSLYELLDFKPSEIPKDFEYAFDKTKRQFYVGDIVETVLDTVLLPIKMRAVITQAESEQYDPAEGDGFSYTIEFTGKDGNHQVLDYPSFYFKLVKRGNNDI